MLDALLFDLDGTLIDTNLLHTDAFFEAFQENGYKVARDRIAIEIGKGGDLLVPAILGKEADKKDGDRIRDSWEKHYLKRVKSQQVRVFPGALELLEAARQRGLKLALATSGQTSVMDAVEKSSGVAWRELFPVVVTSSDADQSKPAPDIISAAQQQLGVVPAACAFVGDTIYDARACRSAGVVCLAVSDEQHAAPDLIEAGARATYPDLKALLDNFEDAMRLASPGPVRWSQRLVDELMSAALEVARQGMNAGEVPIGAVVANGSGQIIARGFNNSNATRSKIGHAEIRALEAARDQIPLDARDAILVTTLEPCVMCAGAAMEGAIETVLYALKSPFNGGVARVSAPRDAGAQMPRFIGPVAPDASRALLQKWLKAHRGQASAQWVEQLLQS